MNAVKDVATLVTACMVYVRRAKPARSPMSDFGPPV